jgi:hypothetical protein
MEWIQPPQPPTLANQEEVLPCPHYQRGHCKGIAKKTCKLSHAAQICWNKNVHMHCVAPVSGFLGLSRAASDKTVATDTWSLLKVTQFC